MGDAERARGRLESERNTLTRAFTPAERARAAELEEQLRDEGLSRAEFDFQIARKQVFRTDGVPEHTDEYLAQAKDFLESHSFDRDLDEKIWRLHARGVSRRDIALRLKGEGVYRKMVNSTVRRLKKLMEGRMGSRARRGRPLDPDSRTDGGRAGERCLQVLVRFNDVEEGMLMYAVDKLRARGELAPARDSTGRRALRHVGPAVLRAALAEYARRL